MSSNRFISSLSNGHALNPAGSKLVIAEWVAVGTPEDRVPEYIAPLHRHNHDDEAWYVLEGTLGFRIGEELLEANAGQAVVVPSGTSHTYWNPRPEEAKYLIIMTERIHSLISDIHSAPARNSETLNKIFKAHDSELL